MPFLFLLPTWPEYKGTLLLASWLKGFRDWGGYSSVMTGALRERRGAFCTYKKRRNFTVSTDIRLRSWSVCECTEEEELRAVT